MWNKSNFKNFIKKRVELEEYNNDLVGEDIIRQINNEN